MCATYEHKGKQFKPFDVITARGKHGIASKVWHLFAQQEKLDFWMGTQQGVFIDITAERFAERNEMSRMLTWDAVPEGRVIRGIEAFPYTPQSKRGKNYTPPTETAFMVVTRQATRDEMFRFGHPRMPLLEEALYG